MLSEMLCEEVLCCSEQKSRIILCQLRPAVPTCTNAFVSL